MAVFHLYIIWYCDETAMTLVVFLKVGQVSESSSGLLNLFRPWTTMPFQITLWTPVGNQKLIRHKNQFTHCIYCINLHIALAPLTSMKWIVIVHVGSLDMDFIAGQQQKYYFIRKSCGPLQTSIPLLRRPHLVNARPSHVQCISLGLRIYSSLLDFASASRRFAQVAYA